MKNSIPAAEINIGTPGGGMAGGEEAARNGPRLAGIRQ